MKVRNLSKGEGRGQTPNPNFFGIHFGSIDIKIWGQSRAFNTYYWIQTLGGRGRQQKVWTKSILLFFLDVVSLGNCESIEQFCLRHVYCALFICFYREVR